MSIEEGRGVGDRDRVRSAILKARRVIRMVQGTMSLEGCGLNAYQLRLLKKRTIKELLEIRHE